MTDNQGGSGGGAPPPGHDQDAEFHTLFEAAKTLDKRARLGLYGPYQAPFTRQFKSQIKLLFPEDRETFETTDRNEKHAIQLGFRLRLITFLVFLVFSASLLIAFDLRTALFGGRISPQWAGFSVFMLIAVVALLLRVFVRHEYFGEIRNEATRFSNYFMIQLNNILDRAINAVRSSTEDLMLTPEWPDRSGGWIKIAMFYEKRYENVDRYVTTAAWRIESRYRMIEGTFVTLKWLIVPATLGLIWFFHVQWDNMLIPRVAASVAYLAISVLLWGLLPKKDNNNYWLQRFRESVVGFDDQKEHIYAQIAKVIAADKRYFMSTQRSSPGKGKDS